MTQLLPVRLKPDERRELVSRIADRLGTKTAGGLALLANEAPDAQAGVRRLILEGAAGEIKVKGVQEFGPSPEVGPGGAARFYQRDKIGIGGFAEELGVILEVDEVGAAEGAPARVKVAFKEGTAADQRAATLEEAYRFAGERFAAAMFKKAAEVRALPLGPATPDEVRKWIRGRWQPLYDLLLPNPPPPHLRGLAAVESPTRKEGLGRLLVREAGGEGRAAAAVAMLAPGGVAGGFEVARGFDQRIVDKALAALLWSAAKETAAEPRGASDPLEIDAPQGLETPGFILAGPLKATGGVRQPQGGRGARLASLDLKLTDPAGQPLGTLVERHVYGLPEGGMAIVASANHEGRTTALVCGPPAQARRWIGTLKESLQ